MPATHKLPKTRLHKTPIKIAEEMVAIKPQTNRLLIPQPHEHKHHEQQTTKHKQPYPKITSFEDE